METKAPFELTNKQRRYLGISPVGDTWEMVRFDDQYLYFDGDIIRKTITSNDYLYEEHDLHEITSQNRTVLLPKTKRGKPKKLNNTSISSFRPLGVYFYFSAGTVVIGNHKTNAAFHFEELRNGVSLTDWLEKWISETTENDQKEFEQYKISQRRHVKYREGDFFAFKIGRRKWGFGRIVLNIAERRKSEDFTARKNYGLDNLMGKPLYIMVYRKIAESLNININELPTCGTLPVQSIMDNNFYYGEYPIIGNRPVTAEEWEPIISYGKSIRSDDWDTVYLQYGLIFKETTIHEFNKYLPDNELCPSPYRNENIGWNLDNFNIIEDIILGKAKVPEDSNDLRALENIDIKREIFTFFGLDADKSYAENLKLANCQ